MDEETKERLFMRSVPVFFGLGLLVLSAAGSANTLAFRTRGVKATGKVLELRVEQRYRTAVYRRSEDYHRVRIGFTDRSGKNDEVWVNATPQEMSDRVVLVGSLQEFLYVPGTQRSMLGAEAPSRTELILWNSVCIPLGLFLIGWGLWGKVPAYPRG